MTVGSHVGVYEADRRAAGGQLQHRVLQPAEDELDISVVVSCYFEEKSIDEFHERLSSTLGSMGRPHEMIFINDGSTDGTFERLQDIFEADSNVSAVIDLFRNVGQSNAKTPGIQLSRGRAIVLIDSDLQLDPEELPRLMEAFDAGTDVVSGYRRDRQDSLSRRLPSLIANFIMRRASSSDLRDFGCTYKVYDARLVHAFGFGPRMPWRPVPVIAAAGRIREVSVNHHPRRFGKSGWTFRKLWAYNMENLVNLSKGVFQVMGLACAALAVLFGLRIAMAFLVPVSLLPRITPGLILSVVVASWLVTVAVLSAVGEFVIRNFGVLQRRPAFAVREILRREPSQ